MNNLYGIFWGKFVDLDYGQGSQTPLKKPVTSIFVRNLETLSIFLESDRSM